jgi:hypothetical protein
MTSAAIPLVKEVIRRSTLTDAQALLKEIQGIFHGPSISDRVDSFMVDHFPDIVRPRMRSAPRSAR